MRAMPITISIEQGSPEWLKFRKTRITATDANVIMSKGSYFGKTLRTLYEEKTSDEQPKSPNERMQRGTDLEPIARELFCIQNGIEMFPTVVIKDWAMASLDGASSDLKYILEIKCPGDKDHATALSGRVPEHYYPQLQHQMYVCDLDETYYYSFDGFDGVTLIVKRDQEFIDRMIIEEEKFYECLVNCIPPESKEDDFVSRQDDIWQDYAMDLRKINEIIKDLEEERESIKKKIEILSGGINSKGFGLSCTQVITKGQVDYDKIPELKCVNLDSYRKTSRTSWRISCH